MSKDMWIDEWDAAFNEAVDRGLSEEDAGQYADTRADGRYRERIADAIDYQRLLKKEGRIHG